ncbi:unnamed protein product, partial [marine sediment metagenome]
MRSNIAYPGAPGSMVNPHPPNNNGPTVPKPV